MPNIWKLVIPNLARMSLMKYHWILPFLSYLRKTNRGLGVGGCSTITPVTQIRLFSRFENMIKYSYSDSIGVSLQSAFPFEVISSEWLIASLKWKSVITKKTPNCKFLGFFPPVKSCPSISRKPICSVLFIWPIIELLEKMWAAKFPMGVKIILTEDIL